MDKEAKGCSECFCYRRGNKTDGSEGSYIVPLRPCKDNSKAKQNVGKSLCCHLYFSLQTCLPKVWRNIFLDTRYFFFFLSLCSSQYAKVTLQNTTNRLTILVFTQVFTELKFSKGKVKSRKNMPKNVDG